MQINEWFKHSSLSFYYVILWESVATRQVFNKPTQYRFFTMYKVKSSFKVHCLKCIRIYPLECIRASPNQGNCLIVKRSRLRVYNVSRAGCVMCLVSNIEWSCDLYSSGDLYLVRQLCSSTYIM